MSLSGNAIDFLEKWLESANAETDTGVLSFETFAHLQRLWSERTFGYRHQRGPLGPMRHLKKEVEEIIAAAEKHQADTTNPKWLNDLLGEYVDGIFLIFDAVWRSGLTMTDLKRAITAKLIVNRARKWGPPSLDQPTEHVRDHAPELGGEG